VSKQREGNRPGLKNQGREKGQARQKKRSDGRIARVPVTLATFITGKEPLKGEE
jgi:hypothetical protein